MTTVRLSRHHPAPLRRVPRLRFLVLALVSAGSLATAGTASAALPQDARLSWPLSPVPAVTRYFDAPETPYGPGHRGVDLAAAPGQQVLAADQGIVVFAGLLAGRPVLSIDHEGGLRTTYEPVVPAVHAGDQVYRGQVVGTVSPGHPGCTVAACLHWGVRRGDEYLDPLALVMVTTAVRLKPWDGQEPWTS
ncbi:M23 family metallopeptidase [Amycolatopsis sp. H20-H5]|uniref:M23 family metallopeptidase n=1 Tax=Amycolatopsis sp. H20-H5 TaxID=3046309 RepID=UPI002DBAE94E|nr:M23 family metallopeptidase [Amycolatopsis sp. H20-H5]MEC3980303.1 M23 family metallopeptidase [Amycolatopsis sp. H20-H5]